jgi:thiol-disulfide isomerase/thioredoxin
MKMFSVLSLIAFLWSGAFAEGKPSPIKVLSGITLRDHTGKMVPLEKKLGKPTLFVFWATWCDPCLMEIQSLVKLQKKYHSKGFQILSVVMDGEEQKDALPALLKTHSINYPVFLADSGLDKVFGGISSLPCSVTISKNGVIGEKSSGFLSEPEIEEKIKALF